MPEITKLRAEMDQVHIELVQLLQKRLDLTEKIWQIKKAQQIPFVDSNREDLILQKVKSYAADEDQHIFLNQVFNTILSEAKKYLKAKLK